MKLTDEERALLDEPIYEAGLDMHQRSDAVAEIVESIMTWRMRAEPQSEDTALGGTQVVLAAVLTQLGLPEKAGLTGLMRHLTANMALTTANWKAVVERQKERLAKQSPQPVMTTEWGWLDLDGHVIRESYEVLARAQQAKTLVERTVTFYKTEYGEWEEVP